MRGRPDRQPNLFVKINLEDLVPQEHPLRPIKRMADEALAAMSRTFAAAYAPAEKGGRPSIPPERLLKALVLMSLYTVRYALRMLDRVKAKLGLEPATLGADKGYDASDFLVALETRDIEPHIACKSRKQIDVPQEHDEGGWSRWFNQRGGGSEPFRISQRKRKLNEEVFGWLKQFGGLRRARLVGRWKLQQLADIALGSLNLIRMRGLLKA